MDIDISGLQELILTVMKAISEINLKTIDLKFIETLLTIFAPLWNPIWAAVNAWLHNLFGF